MRFRRPRLRPIAKTSLFFGASGAVSLGLFSPVAHASVAQNTSEESLLRADASGLLWSAAPLKIELKTSVSRLDFVNAAGAQINFLNELRGWRDTLRGSGTSPSRNLYSWKNQSLGASFAVGKIAAPTLSGLGFSGDNGAGLRANFDSKAWGTLEIGTSFRPKALGEALAEFDGALSGQNVKAAPANTAHYLRAKPRLAQNLDLEISALRATRGTDGQNGNFLSGKGQLKLPGNWLASGEWTRAELAERQARERWSVKALGDLAHPFGAARAEFERREIEAGFATFSGENRTGEEWLQGRITQPIKRGGLSGQIQIVANERERDDLENALFGEELKRRTAQTDAHFALQISPEVSVRATGKLVGAQSQKSAAENGAAAPSQFLLDETVGTSGEIGLEWRFSKALRLSATTGITRTDEWRRDARLPDENEWAPTQKGEENRVALEIRHQMGENQFGLKYGARERKNGLSETETPWQEIETVRLEAGRKFSDDLKIRTLIDLARDRETPWRDQNALARRAEAQISLLQTARLDLRMRDGAALPGDLLSDALGNPFGSISNRYFQTGDRELAARFNAGSAQGGNGLGFALEYARTQRGQEELDSWKVGLTFR